MKICDRPEFEKIYKIILCYFNDLYHNQLASKDNFGSVVILNTQGAKISPDSY